MTATPVMIEDRPAVFDQRTNAAGSGLRVARRILRSVLRAVPPRRRFQLTGFRHFLSASRQPCTPCLLRFPRLIETNCKVTAAPGAWHIACDKRQRRVITATSAATAA